MQNLRGVGHDVLIVDEAAFTPSDIYPTAIYPIIAARKAAWVQITTPSTRSSEFWRSVHAADPATGLLIVRSVILALRCDSCRKAPMAGDESAAACLHRRFLIPRWIGVDAQDKLRHLMASSQANYEQEVLGASQADAGAIFSEHHLRAVRENTLFTVEHVVACLDRIPRLDVFIGVDPGLGGQGKAAVVSFILLTPAIQVILGVAQPLPRALMLVRITVRVSHCTTPPRPLRCAVSRA